MKLANLVIAKLFDQVTRQILKKYLWFMNHLVKQGRLPLQDKLWTLVIQQICDVPHVDQITHRVVVKNIEYPQLQDFLEVFTVLRDSILVGLSYLEVGYSFVIACIPFDFWVLLMGLHDLGQALLLNVGIWE